MTEGTRDELGIYIPVRASSLSDTEILEYVDQLQARRESVLSELAAVKRATAPKGKKEKVADLSKLQADEVIIVLAAQMGISVDEFRRLVSST